jgi:outer membrane protein, heavy metal efflux system
LKNANTHARIGHAAGALIVAMFLMAHSSMVLSADPAGLEELEKRLVKGASAADLVAYAFQTNPSLQEARESWKAVVERHRITTAYPDPQILMTYFPTPIETRLGPQDWNLNLTQAIPFPGKLSKAGELVEADAQIARLNLDRTLRDIIVKIRESYYELRYIQEAKRIVGQNRDLLEHLRKVGETAYAKDRAAFLDVVKAQSQSAQLQYDAILLDELEQTEMTQLNSLLNRSPGAEIRLQNSQSSGPVIFQPEEIYALAEKNQEEILVAEKQIQKAEAKAGLAKYEYAPDFRVGLFYAGIGKPDVALQPRDAGRDAVGVQVGLSIPLWFGKNNSRLDEARAEMRRAQAGKSAQVNSTQAQIRAVFFRLKNAGRLIRLYRDELLPQAAKSMEIAEVWFREKEGSFSDFVETEAVYYNFQLTLARARADYEKYLARLERLVGRSVTEQEASQGRPSPVGGSR